MLLRPALGYVEKMKRIWHSWKLSTVDDILIITLSWAVSPEWLLHASETYIHMFLSVWLQQGHSLPIHRSHSHSAEKHQAQRLDPRVMSCLLQLPHWEEKSSVLQTDILVLCWSWTKFISEKLIVWSLAETLFKRKYEANSHFWAFDSCELDS